MIPRMLVNWARLDANAAFGGVGRRAPSPLRDAAIAELVTKSPNLAGESAADWVLEIQDSQLRHTTVGQVSEPWKNRDPAAANAWLRQQGLSK